MTPPARTEAGERALRLALAYDTARRELWAACGDGFSEVVGVGADDPRFLAAAREADVGFKASRQLGPPHLLRRAAEARERLFAACSGLIADQANRRAGRTGTLRASRDDLFQAAAAEALRALDRFDPGRGTAPSTYLAKFIRAAMQGEERRAPPTTIPGQAAAAWARAARTAAKHRAETGEELEADDLAARLGTRPDGRRRVVDPAILAGVERAIAPARVQIDDLADTLPLPAGQARAELVEAALRMLPASEQAALRRELGLTAPDDEARTQLSLDLGRAG